MRTLTWSWLAASLIPGLVLAQAGDTENVPVVHFEPYAFIAADGTEVAAEMGTLQVPENRSRPDSRKIGLKFVRFASTATEPGSPIVYLAGGPGGSGLAAATGSRFPLFMAFREIADVIALDQRGTGATGGIALRCFETFGYPSDQPGDEEAMLAAAREAAANCARSIEARGIDISGYNSVESADDLDALRRALGAEKITLWGISYGTHLGLATLKRHGQHIDRVILAGLEGPDQSYKLPSNVQKLMEEIAAIAAADPAIHERIPDLLQALQEILDRLERQPVTADGVTLGAFDVRLVVSSMLRGPSSFESLPGLIYDMQQGDFSAIARASARYRSGPAGHAMSYAMDCASGATAARLERIAWEAEETLLADAINYPFPGICTAWKVPDLGDAFRANVRTDVPALFISGTLDGRTPPSNAEELLPGFSNAAHLVIEGAGHSDPLFLSSPEIAETMLAFLRGEPIEDRTIVLPPVRLKPLATTE